MRMIPQEPPVEEKQFGESDMLRMQFDQYAEQQRQEQFFKLHYRSLKLILKVKDAFPLYFYMCDNITRGTSSYPWWNEVVLPYYYDGYLPFGKHHSSIAKDLGIKPITVARQLKELSKHEIIVPLARERYPEKKDVMVYSVGRWMRENRYEEIYYLQVLSARNK